MRSSTNGMRIGVCLSLVFLLSGCFSFTMYESPTTGPTASMEFPYVGNPIGGGGIRRISIGEAEGCTNRRWHPWRDTAKLAEGKPLYIIQGYYYGAYGGGCYAAYTFTPKAGEKYISEFDYGDRRCRIRLLRVSSSGAKIVVPEAKPIDVPNCWGT